MVASSVGRTMSSPILSFDAGGFAADAEALRVEDVRELTAAMPQIDRDLPDDRRIELVRALTDLVNGAEAAQAELVADFDTSMRAKAAEKRVPKERQGRGIAAQVALARRESLHRGEQFRQLSTTVREMPYTRATWRLGLIPTYTVQQLLTGTACLSREDRVAVDAEVAADPDALEQMSPRQAGAAASAAAYRADPMSFVERRRKAEAERCTSLRPAPDVMTWFSALLPVKQGVAVHAALSVAADQARAAGDPRSRRQIMADLLVERVVAPMVGRQGWRGPDGQRRGP